MKKTLIGSLATLIAMGVFAQGTLVYNNRVVGETVSKVYGPEVGNVYLSKTGNTSADTVAGTQTYSGGPLSGTGYSAQLWAAPGANAPEASLVAVAGTLTAFRTGAGIGWFTGLSDPTIPGAPAGTVATLQLRVWDNLGGTLTTWAQASAAWSAGTIAAGVFTFNSDPLAGPPPNPTASYLHGLQSFNIYMVPVPEPSTFVLAGLGAAGLLIFRRRK